MFELVQGLTADGNANPVTNALKDLFFTNWITAALDGTDLSRSVADILTLGGISDMKKNAENYADQALCGGDQVCDPAEKYKK
jgi:hypothetical protein